MRENGRMVWTEGRGTGSAEGEERGQRRMWEDGKKAIERKWV